MNHLIITQLNEVDIDEIVLAFQQIGWHKPRDLYESYLKEQASGLRLVFVARENGTFCGYVTLKWISDYSPFTENNIPEIVDLNVLPEYRKQGIGTKLIQACEQAAKEQSRILIGLGVGLTTDYGNAQRLYIHLGYVPDGRGIHYKCQVIKYSELVSVDDDLVLYLTKSLAEKLKTG
ncbi:MAG: GNAT family N-acetyltransferase [Gammaproteobacteria bacterium]|nr:GNAT family N-acetyltransferase [Gammaproteobacteria bacterium]MCW5583812.1 GNAT family N-acetyltransferase [Gammaproteobacteria bacterium]